MKVAILALQGAFLEHEHTLDKLGVSYLEVRQKRDLLHSFDALILPGGESTVQGKLLYELDLFKELKLRIEHGLPVFGTCAGLLLLAKNICGNEQTYFRTMDLTAVRNAYGRQLGSFYTEEYFKGLGKVPMTFIRAPYIQNVSADTEILAVCDGKIVAARQGNQLVTAFHPELNDDFSIHNYFLKTIASSFK